MLSGSKQIQNLSATHCQCNPLQLQRLQNQLQLVQLQVDAASLLTSNPFFGLLQIVHRHLGNEPLWWVEPPNINWRIAVETKAQKTLGSGTAIIVVLLVSPRAPLVQWSRWHILRRMTRRGRTWALCTKGRVGSFAIGKNLEKQLMECDWRNFGFSL